MTEVLPLDSIAGVARAMATLRHALADPLSAAGLKLELVERRLEGMRSGGSPPTEKIRGAKADLEAAGRLIDVLARLAAIAEEVPEETSMGSLCRLAGVPLEGGGWENGPVVLRRQATVDSLAGVSAFLGFCQGSEAAPPRASLEVSVGTMGLRMAAAARFAGTEPEWLFSLPRGQEFAVELFLARATVEADGGLLQLVNREGWLTAVFSWRASALRGVERPAG
ncbi:MAG: hypothetical protein L6R30_03275 [Thermoanaerobaculia bacterium]|nr:hypothetical protein [Thermoanaerobaculia bacterium]